MRYHEPFPGYSSTSYWIRLRSHFTLDDLKAMDGTYGLPLASARYDSAEYLNGYWLHFADRAMSLFADPFDIAEKLKALPPIETAQPMGIGYGRCCPSPHPANPLARTRLPSPQWGKRHAL